MIAVALLIVLITLFLYIIAWAHNRNKYWERKGLKTLKPLPFVGNTLPIILRKKHSGAIYQELCKTFPNEPLLGYYENIFPRLIVQDREYIERVLIKDFQHFTDHGFVIPDEKKKPIDHYQLFSLTGTKWRAFRYKMSPLFTSGKLKQFYEALDICGEKFIKFIDRHPKKEINLKEAVKLLVMEYVGMAIFGLDTGAIENPDSEFNEMGANVFELNPLTFFFVVLAPKIGEWLNLTFIKRKTVDYYCKVIQDAFTERKKLGIKRNDFIQMMIQLKEKGKIEVNKWDPNDNYLKDDNYNSTESFELTDVSLMSQAFTFLTTGLDTVSTSLMFCVYELSMHQDVQSRARTEIFEQIEQHSGLTYDALKKMTFLENCISESARLHPIVLAIFRICTKDYTFPNGLKVKEGEHIHIPVATVQTNPNYFSNPLEFRPERFDEPILPGTYFPFGDGPRICIAMRFALLQVKYILAKIMMKYNIKLSPKTKLPLRMKTMSLIVEPENPLYFDLEPINI